MTTFKLTATEWSVDAYAVKAIIDEAVAAGVAKREEVA